MGMFDSLQAPGFRDELAADKTRFDRAKFMAQDPFHAGAMTSYEGAELAGQGLARTAAGLMGRDTRTPDERRRASLENAKAEMAKLNIDLSTPEGRRAYYQGMQDILRRNGLAAEAGQVAQQAMKDEDEALNRDIKRDQIKQRGDAEKAKAANVAEANRIKALRTQQLAAQGMPEFIQYIDRIEKEQNPVMRKQLMNRLNQMAGGKIVVSDAGDVLAIHNQRGELLGYEEKGEKPMSPKDAAADRAKTLAFPHKYLAAMQGLQAAYKSAADLHNHPGLDNFVGRLTGLAAAENADTESILGRLVREGLTITRTDAGLNALGLWKQVRGETFIRALKDLKDASPTGASGLGQLSNAEGDKIGNAKANLFSRQNAADFRVALRDYIDSIVQAAERISAEAVATAEATGMDLQPMQIAAVPLTGPARPGRAGPKGYPDRPQPPRAPTRPAPSAAPAAPAPRGGGVHWVIDENGELKERQ